MMVIHISIFLKILIDNFLVQHLCNQSLKIKVKGFSELLFLNGEGRSASWCFCYGRCHQCDHVWSMCKHTNVQNLTPSLRDRPQ